MRITVFILLVVMSVLRVNAQDLANCVDKDFRAHMNALVSKGNRCYEVDNRVGIKLMADSIIKAINQRNNAGNLHKMDSLEYIADWHKLMGSLYYEESYYDTTFYVKAENHYNQALTIYQETSSFEMDMDKGIIIHRELANLYYKWGNYSMAFDQAKMAYDALQKAVDQQVIYENDADYLSLQTQLALCYARTGRCEEGVRLINRQIDLYEKHDVRYAEALRKKAKILMLREEYGGKDSKVEALNCYRKYFGLKKKDALANFLGMNSEEREQYWVHIRPFVTDCYRLEDADAGFLYDVTLFAKGLLLQIDSAGGGRQSIHATWQMVQKKLQPDACAIEFIQYEKFGQQQMGALVLKKTGMPVFVKMAQPDSVMNYEIGPRTVKERIYDNNGARKNALYKDSVGFFKMIWNDSLLSAIGNSRWVYFSPDGYIHQIAIEYMLPLNAGRLHVCRLSSTRSLLAEKVNVSHDKALIIGGVDYNNSEGTSGEDNDAVAFGFLKGSRFKILPTSMAEVKQISDYRQELHDSLIAGRCATEQFFRDNCGKYPIIHISTHGVFSAATTPQGTDIKPCMSEETLSQSIIALSGLQKNLDNGNFNSQMQDGAISAKEISSLDMGKVKLVVLACCETGLGYVTADGVYGIQRGLKNAGVKAIVCTLWDIDDKASSFFMVNLHKYIAEGLTVYRAFQKARDDMKNYSEQGNDSIAFNASTMTQVIGSEGNDFSEPCDRDAFILIDALE